MYIPIPDDIYGYESKTFGNFTARQVVCFLLGLAVIAPMLFVMLRATGSVDLSALVAILLGMPVLMCGFIKQDGQYLERVILFKLRWKFKYPQHRPFRMHNLYLDIESEGNRLEKLELEQTEKEKETQTHRRAVGKTKNRPGQHTL